jgi:tetratricopeptide (TPR) repeat protein
VSLKGDLTKALELLKRGLELKPDHYLCRFNHGVILFKLGLILEATSDFHRLSTLHPEDPVVAYNLALCNVQLGLFHEASTICDVTIKREKDDPKLLYDACKVKGIALFRLG